MDFLLSVVMDHAVDALVPKPSDIQKKVIFEMGYVPTQSEWLELIHEPNYVRLLRGEASLMDALVKQLTPDGRKVFEKTKVRAYHVPCNGKRYGNGYWEIVADGRVRKMTSAKKMARAFNKMARGETIEWKALDYG